VTLSCCLQFLRYVKAYLFFPKLFLQYLERLSLIGVFSNLLQTMFLWRPFSRSRQTVSIVSQVVLSESLQYLWKYLSQTTKCHLYNTVVYFFSRMDFSAKSRIEGQSIPRRYMRWEAHFEQNISAISCLSKIC
jgi:hypothetical protein